jgi:hypothetical protein
MDALRILAPCRCGTPFPLRLSRELVHIARVGGVSPAAAIASYNCRRCGIVPIALQDVAPSERPAQAARFRVVV